MNKKIKYILIIVSAVLALTGMVIWGVMSKENVLKDNTVIEIDGETSKTLKAEISGFYPGKSEEYVIRLTGSGASDYEVSLNFKDDNGGSLKNYLTVTITTADTTVEKPLKEILSTGEISLGKNATEIHIKYTMPEEVGNEAKETSVTFYIELTATNGDK